MALSALWFVILSVVFLIFVGFVIWLVVEAFKEKEPRKDDAIALNFCSHLPGSNGRFLGIEKNHETGKRNRHVVTLQPADIKVDAKEAVPDVTVVVDSNKRIIIPKGGVSADRNIVVYLAPNASDYPEELKNTVIGRALMWASELANYEKLVVDILREGGERKDALLNTLGDGEISKEFIQFQEGLVVDYLQKVVNPQTMKEKAATLNLTSSSPSTQP